MMLGRKGSRVDKKRQSSFRRPEGEPFCMSGAPRTGPPTRGSRSSPPPRGSILVTKEEGLIQ